VVSRLGLKITEVAPIVEPELTRGDDGLVAMEGDDVGRRSTTMTGSPVLKYMILGVIPIPSLVSITARIKRTKWTRLHNLSASDGPVLY
jgi:hypothetical protein